MPLSQHKLNTPLFYRNNRGVELTPKGKLFLQYSEQILKLISDAETAMNDTDNAHGSLSVGSLETIAQIHLPGLLSEYCQRRIGFSNALRHNFYSRT